MKILIFVTLSLGYQLAYAQIFTVDFKVRKIVYLNDSIETTEPKQIEINTSGLTDIIEIGAVGKNKIGLRLEILKSKLDTEVSFLAGKNYFIKPESGTWQKIGEFHHQKVRTEPIHKRGEAESRRQSDILLIENKSLQTSLLNQTNAEEAENFRIYYWAYYYTK